MTPSIARDVHGAVRVLERGRVVGGGFGVVELQVTPGCLRVRVRDAVCLVHATIEVPVGRAFAALSDPTAEGGGLPGVVLWSRMGVLQSGGGHLYVESTSDTPDAVVTARLGDWSVSVAVPRVALETALVSLGAALQGEATYGGVSS
jgi:hypothetical protein